MRKFIIEPEYNNYKIKDYLKDIKGYSTRALRGATIYLNGKKVRVDKKIKKLNRLVVVEEKKSTNIRPIPMDLKIVFEDKNLIIINKDPHIVVHPTLKKTDLTLANGVVDYLYKATGEIQVPRFFNRLDMDTSGLIVVTKNAFTQAFLQEKSKNEKFYLAICEGIVKENEFFINKPIGRVGDNIKRQELSIENGGQIAKTKVKVVQRFPEKNLTLVELQLFTGRTHQIRVHLSLEGHPILGDSLYGKEEQPVKRQLLHSYKFSYTDVDSHDQKFIKIDLPDDMKEVLDIK